MSAARPHPLLAAFVAVAFACGDDAPTASVGASPAPATTESPASPTTPPSEEENGGQPPAPLDLKFLGVGGFLIQYGSDAVLTAPLYTRPSLFEVMGGQDVVSDDANVASDLTPEELARVRAILSGHAHYDHLLDVPGVMTRATNATLYSNDSAKKLLAAYAPDRAPACDGTPAPAKPIARSRVVALDDPAASVVDYRSCPDLRPDGAPLEGTWVSVPGTNLRLLSICSEHPDQFGPVHFAPGDVVEEPCEPPKRMDAWKEGRTLAFLVDFLDGAGKPVHRVYYQDAPTIVPIGLPPEAILAGKRVDVALLTVGSSNNVPGAPTTTLKAITPRYVIGHHWEDFFVAASEPPRPIAFLDVAAWQAEARTEVPAGAEASMRRNGTAAAERAFVAQPGDTFAIPPAP